jgi:hypothetical protein
VYREQGGDALVVNPYRGGKIKGCTSAAATPAQAATLAAVATTGTFSTGIAVKINSMRLALIRAGILATG